MYVRILCDKGQILNPWLCSLKNVLDKCGLSNLWCDHESYHYNSSWIKTTINQRLRDQFLQKWHNDIQESTKGVIYRIYKTNGGVLLKEVNVIVICVIVTKLVMNFMLY